MFSLLNGADISAAEREMAGEAYEQGVRDGRAETDALACAVADAWRRITVADPNGGHMRIKTPLAEEDSDLTDPLQDALDALEYTTRQSPLRKVKP